MSAPTGPPVDSAHEPSPEPAEEPSTRPAALLRETAAVLEERGASYDNDSYATIKLTAKLWTGYLDREVTPREVCVLMALHKVARQRSDPEKEDSYVDAAGYVALAASVGGDDA